MQKIPTSEKIFLVENLNGHVGKDSRGFERVHGGLVFGERKELRDIIL